MDDQKKQYFKIGIIISCLVLAVGIFFFTHTGSSSGKAPSEYTLLCANPQCKHVMTVSREEYLEKMQEAGSMAMPGKQIAFECEKCGKKSAFIATKCEKCSQVFFPNYQSKDYHDRCPECGYSKLEEKIKK